MFYLSIITMCSAVTAAAAAIVCVVTGDGHAPLALPYCASIIHYLRTMIIISICHGLRMHTMSSYSAYN